MKNLERQISEAASMFALQIIEIIKSATLQELSDLQGDKSLLPKKRGRKPGTSMLKESTSSEIKKVDGRRNRIVKNYPKCAFPKCSNNRFPRGEGFCGVHWRQWKDGKIKAASDYPKKNS